MAKPKPTIKLLKREELLTMKDFQILDKYKHLSLSAIGLLFVILRMRLEDGFTVQNLSKYSNDSEPDTRKALNELIKNDICSKGLPEQNE